MQSLLAKFKHGLQRTKTRLVRQVQALYRDGAQVWCEETYEELEAALIAADLGVAVSMRLVEEVRDRYERGLIHSAADVIAVAQARIAELVAGPDPEPAWPESSPLVILLVGVNGTGKTTTAGKLAARWQQQGKSVMLAACDTFRAAAIEQIRIWGERVACPVVAGRHGSDAAAVAYDAATAAVARGIDVLLVDTAGRQHTRKSLMDELAKIRRTLAKACPGAPHETWLVVDGSTGTNALSQTRQFGQTTPLTGLCLTKLDGTSKGGVVVPIHDELGVPVRFVGLGEGIDDLQPFSAAYFAEALFAE